MPQLIEPLQLYRRILVDEFIREWQFLLDVIAGRATGRADFTDKLLVIIKSGMSVVLGQAVVPGLGLLDSGFQIAVEWANEKRKDRHDKEISLQEYKFDNEEIRSLMESVALEACRRYQQIILQELSQNPMEGVVPLAKVGVERMLEYLVRTKKPLKFEHLLDGLIAGHSGAYVMGYTNTQLSIQESGEKSLLQRLKNKAGFPGFTGEGVYGRSGFMTEDGALFALFDKEKAFHRQKPSKMVDAPKKDSEIVTLSDAKAAVTLNKEALFHYGYTKARQGTKDPKYSYMHVSPAVVHRWYGHLPESQFKQAPGQLSSSLQAKISHFKSSIVAIERANLVAYLTARLQEKTLSLKEFVRKSRLSWSEVEVVLYEPKLPQELDLRDLSFAGADLRNCVFQRCIFGGSLVNTNMQGTDCRFSDFTNVTVAENLILSEAELQHSKLSGANFRKVNLTGANLSYASAEGTDLTGAFVLGAIWHKARISGVKISPDQNLSKIQAQQNEFMEEQQRQVTKLEESLQSEQQALLSLQEQLRALQSKPQEAHRELQAMVQAVYQEQQARLAFERSIKSELIRVKTAQKLTQQKVAQHEVQITALDVRLQMIEKQQKDFNAVSQDVQKLAAAVVRNEVDVQVLNQKVASLDERFERTLEAQQIALQQLSGTIDKMQQDLQGLKQQVRHALVTDEIVKKLAEKAKESLRISYCHYQDIRGMFGKPLKLEGQYINPQVLVQFGLKDVNNAEPKNEMKTHRHKEKSLRSVKNVNDVGTKNEREVQRSQERHVSSFENLFGAKRSIVAGDLFKPDNVLFPESSLPENPKNTAVVPNLLLIQGRAGVGKTTFIRFINREWAKGVLYSSFEWVFTLTIRDLRNTEFKKFQDKGRSLSLWEWVYYSQFSGHLLNEEDFGSVWRREIEPAIKAGRVLVVVDGLDEIPVEHPCQRALDSLLAKEYASIPKLITSRPYGISRLPEERRNLEIIGFTDQNIEQYIRNYFDGQAALTAQLISFLRKTPALWATCHIPVNINLICGITESSSEKTLGKELEALQTMTGIYTNMEDKIFERTYLEQDTSVKRERLPESKARRTVLLSKYYDKERIFLAELAFIGLQNEEVILSGRRIDALLDKLDIKDDAEFMKSLKHLGIIKPVLEEGGVRESEQSYEYLHLIFQEFYAAIYISLQLRNEAAKIKVQHFILSQKLNARWQIVWWFVAGLLKEHPEEFSSYINLLEGRTLTAPEIDLNRDLIGHYEDGLLIKCLEENSFSNAEVFRRVQTRMQKKFASLCAAWVHGRIKLSRDLPLLTALRLSSCWLHLKGNTDLLYLTLRVFSVLEIVQFATSLKLVTPKVIEFVSEIIKDERPAALCVALKAVRKLGVEVIGPEFLQRLPMLLQHSFWEIRKDAVFAACSLKNTVSHETIMLLVRLGRDDHWEVRDAVAKGMSEFGVEKKFPEILQALIILLQDQIFNVRSSAVCSVGKLGIFAATPEILQLLINLMKHEDIRSLCLSSICSLSMSIEIRNKSLQEFLAFLKGSDTDTHKAVYEAVGKLLNMSVNPEFLEKLLGLLRGKNPNDHKIVIKIIEKLEPAAVDRKFLSGLIILMKNDDPAIREVAQKCISSLRTPLVTSNEFLQGLLDLLQDKRESVRKNASKVIGELGEIIAVPYFLQGILTLMRCDDFEIQDVAGITINYLGASAAKPEFLRGLVLFLNEDLDLDLDSYECELGSKVCAISRANKVIAGTEVMSVILEKIVKLGNSKDARVREFAISALNYLNVQAATYEVLELLPALLLDNDSSNIREGALLIVNKMGNLGATPKILESIVILLQDVKSVSCWQATILIVGTLDKVNADILKNLLLLLGNVNLPTELREEVSVTISSLKEKAASLNFMQGLARLLRDKDKGTRCLAAKSVSGLGSKVSREILLALGELLDEEDAVLKKIVLETIKELGAAASILQKIAKLMNDKDIEVCIAAINLVRGLGASISQEIQLALLGKITDLKNEVQEAVIGTIDEISVHVANFLMLDGLLKIALNKSLGSEQRCVALNAIEKLGTMTASSPTVQRFIKLLEDNDSGVNYSTFKALRIFKASAIHPDILKKIIKVIHEESFVTEAFEILGVFGEAAITDEIFEALTEFALHRNYAGLILAEAVGRIVTTPRQAIRFLPIILCLTKKSSTQPQFESYMDTLSDLLSKFCFSAQLQDLPILLTLLKDSDEYVRDLAYRVLDEIGIFNLLKKLISEWFNYSVETKLHNFSSIVLLSFLAGFVCYQARWLEESSQYCLEGCIKDVFFQLKLTQELAQWFRRLPRNIIEQYVNTGWYNEELMLKEIQGWPNAAQDLVLADSRIGVQMKSLVQQEKTSIHLSVKSELVSVPLMFSTGSHSPVMDIWEGIFAPLRATEEYNTCCTVPVLIKQEGQQVRLKFQKDSFVNEDLLETFGSFIQERDSKTIPNATVNFPEVVFTLISDIQAKRFTKFLTEKSGLKVERSIDSQDRQSNSEKMQSIPVTFSAASAASAASSASSSSTIQQRSGSSQDKKVEHKKSDKGKDGKKCIVM